MKIGILQTGHAPDEIKDDLGDYGDMFQKLLAGHGFDFALYPVVDGVFPDSVSDCDGWLITGSKHGAYEDHPWIPPLEQFIRDVYADGRPMIGVCFGHQIIAQALGGKVEKFPGGWAVGRQEYDFGGTPVSLNAWHQDQVTERPAGATVIASNDFCENAALLYDDRILTVQAHPEFTGQVIEGLIRHRGRGNVPDPLLDDALDALAAPIENMDVAARMAAFFTKEKTDV